MKFSVVVPTYNSARFLAHCLDSLAGQDCPRDDFEVLVADDGSSDDTLALARGYAPRFAHLHVLALRENRGPGAARNAGVDAARGDWVLFVDSDDALAADALSALDACLRAHSGRELDAIGYDWRAEDLGRGLKSSKRVGRRDGAYLGERGTLLRQYLSHRMDGSVIYTAVRRALLEAQRIRFSQGLHEDVDFIFRVYARARACAYLDRALYHKRNRPESIVNSISAAHIDGYFRAWQAVGRELAALPLAPAQRADYAACFRYGCIAVIATRVREVIRHCSEPMRQGELFALILRHARQMMPPEDLERQLQQAQTVYYAIARSFWRIMNAGDSDARHKTGAVVAEVDALSGKSWSCVDLHHSLFLRPDEVRTCCKRFFVDGEMRGDVVLLRTAPARASPLDPKALLAAKRELHQRINAGETTPCDGCPFLEFRDWSPLNELDIRYLSLEHHSVCNLECSYCSDDYYGGKEANYDLAATMDALLAGDNLRKCDLIVWGGGEPVIAKDFAPLLARLAAQLPQAQQRVLTNAVKRAPALETLLRAQRAQIVTSIDAGSEDVFLRVRGRPGLERVCRNLRSYAEANPARVTIKYIFTEGNGSEADVRDFSALMTRARLLHCNFQISGDFKHEHIARETAEAMVLMYGLLRKAGAAVVYFDELLRHRLGTLIDVADRAQVQRIHASAGLEFIATPERYPTLVVWGAGQLARYYLDSSSFFRRAQVAFFVDSTPAKIGTRFYGKPVEAPQALHASPLPVLVAAVQGYPLILEQYRALGLAEGRLIRDLVL